MNIKHFLATLLGAAAVAAVVPGAAQAATLTEFTLAPNNIVEDFSSAGTVAFNLDLYQQAATSLTFTVSAEDLAGPTLSFNALVRNLSNQGLNGFGFAVNGVSFTGAQGSVTPQFTNLSSLSAGPQSVAFSFNGPEYAELHFGNPLGEQGYLDWSLSTAGLKAGDTFTVTSPVPEPGNVAMMLAGLGVFAFAARRRKQK